MKLLVGGMGGVSFEWSIRAIVMWDRRVVELLEHYVGKFLVACHFKSVNDGFEWAFASVYGPN